MRIQIVTDAWEPQVNGVVRTLKMTRRELEAMGHEVDIVSPLAFRTVPCPTYPEIRLSLTMQRGVRAVIDRFAPDRLHIATEGPLGWMARRVARDRRWNFSTAYHTRFPEYVYARFRVPLSWTYGLLRRFHGAGRAVLAPTPAIVSDLTARGFANVRLWSRGVDLQTFHPDGERIEAGARPVFLYVGRIAVEKNVEAFLDLDLPGEKWVAGAGPALPVLQQRYPGVRWFGVLSGLELAALYRSADVFVFPSRTDTFGLVLLEAMASGTPVAAYPVEGPVDVIGDSDAGVMHEDLRTACLQALELSRERARARAEQFSWTAASEQFVSNLQAIV